MDWFAAEFIAAEIRRLSGVTIGDLWQGHAGIDYIGVSVQAQIVVGGLKGLSFLGRSSIDKYPIVGQDSVLFESRSLEKFFKGLISTDLSIVIDPLEQTFGFIAPVCIVVHGAVSRG